NFKADGKDYTPTGPRVAKGTTVAAKKIDDQTIELTYKLKDKTVETDSWQLSADGKTLTNTVTFPGQSKPEVDVHDRHEDFDFRSPLVAVKSDHRVSFHCPPGRKIAGQESNCDEDHSSGGKCNWIGGLHAVKHASH